MSDVPQDRAGSPNRRATSVFDGTVGPVMPGHDYTGVSVVFHGQTSGSRHVGWSGEAHGQWGGETDPAREILRSARPYKVGGEMFHPEYALFSSRNPDNPKGPQRSHTLFLQDAGLHR